MGLHWVVPFVAGILLLATLPTGTATPNEPVVFAVAWGEFEARFFPHPDICVGEATTDRHRVIAAGYHFDSDGCTEGQRAVLGWIDDSGTGHRTETDRLFLQPAPGGRVQEGDARLTPSEGFSAGSIVKTGNADEGRHTRIMERGSWDLVDLDRDGRWSPGDVAYLDADGNGYLSPGDLVIGPDGLRPVLLGTEGMYHRLEPIGEVVCYLDDNGNGRWDQGEPIYLSPSGCVDVNVGDLRLSATRNLPVGLPVREADLDYRNLLTPFEAPQGVLSRAGDRIVIDLDGSGVESVGDLLLQGGFNLLGPGEATGAALTPAGRWAYLDRDGSGTATPGDLLYVDMDENGRVSAGDVRLTALFGAPMASIVQPGDPDDTGPLPPRSDPPVTVDEASPAASETGKIPAPAMVWFLVAVALAARRLRRE